MTIEDIVLVGGGLAAARATESLRDAGYDGRVALVTEELDRPYERPPLSKGVLTGSSPDDDVYVHDEAFYVDRDIELVTADRVTAIDRDASSVTTAAGRELRFDRLLLATGAGPRTLPLGGGRLEGLVTLRTLDDARSLRERLRVVNHVTVVGAGWIGSEVTAAARTLGTEVTLVDPLDTPLQRVVGHRVGRVFAELHRDHGVDLRLGVGVTGADGADAVERVTLSDGAVVDTELVVVGIGVVPRVELAVDAGLDVDDGIVVDATLASSDPRILAAGDVANAWNPALGARVRVEHWANALNQGAHAGRALLGDDAPYDRLPYFYSDQYDLGLEYVGHAPDWDDLVIRGDLGSREFVSFWLRDGRVAAAMNVNVWDVVEDLKGLITAGRPVDPIRLADVDTPLADVAAVTSA